MKKTIIIAILLSIFVSVSAQKKRQSEKDDAYVASILSAVKENNFTFSAMSMKPSLGKIEPVDISEKSFDIVPGHIMVELPYDDAPSTAYRIPEFLRVDQPDYESEYREDDKNLYLKVTVSGMPKTPINPNSRLVFEFKIKKSNGSATVEVTPDITHPITYYGSIIPK